MNQHHGMTLQAFLTGGHLKRGDIVLCRGKKGLTSRLICWGTKSYFSHAALVFAVPHLDEGFDKAFVIESQGKGVDLTDLSHYLDSDHYDIAIKRLEQPWFETPEARLPKMIRGHMLNFIKGSYDYLMILRIAISLGYSMLFHRAQAPFEEVLQQLLEQQKILPSRFICSGFVQHGYYKTIEKEVARGNLPAQCLQEVTFHPGNGASSTARRLATSPKELALSDRLEWKFASQRQNGETFIYPIATRGELEELFGPL